jgi:hypothetical protein
MAVITDLLQIVGAWIEGVFEWITDAFEGVLEIFYDTTTSTFTVLGTLLLLGIAMGIVFFALRYIRSLIAK